MSSQVDYVVIGAGSAGCAVAARLSEDADVRVVVLEAGGPDTLEAIHQPPMWPALWGSEVDWAYETTPQEANGGLVHQWPRGKVLGGSSSLNGMVYLRGNPADFDDWAYHGCKGWDYDALLPFFRRMEDVPDGDPHYRGRGGPNTPRPARDPNPICAAFVEAAREKGHPVTDDHNGAQFEGAGYHDMIITAAGAERGRRLPAPGRRAAEPRDRDRRARPRAAVRGDRCAASATRATAASTSCASPARSSSAPVRSSRPRCCCAPGSGRRPSCARSASTPSPTCPASGATCTTTCSMGVCWEAAQPVPPPAYNLAESSMLTRSDPALRVPDLHFMCIHVPYHLPIFSVPEGSWTIAVGLVRPASRGTLRLRSADPADTPLIDPAYLREEADSPRWSAASRSSATSSPRRAFDDWRGPEALPGEDVRATARCATSCAARRAATSTGRHVQDGNRPQGGGRPRAARARHRAASASPTLRSCRMSSRRTRTRRR